LDGPDIYETIRNSGYLEGKKVLMARGYG
jgi:hypothetical protein